jgi:hypothetical protein
MTTKANLYVNQGVTYSLNIGITDGEDFDLDDYNFFMSASKLYSSIPIFEGTFTKKPATNSQPINSVDLIIDGEDTLDAAPGKYVYDVLMTHIETEVSEKILEGLLFVQQTITRP